MEWRGGAQVLQGPWAGGAKRCALWRFCPACNGGETQCLRPTDGFGWHGGSILARKRYTEALFRDAARGTFQDLGFAQGFNLFATAWRSFAAVVRRASDRSNPDRATGHSRSRQGDSAQ